MKRTIFIILICFVSCIEDQIFQYENVYRKETKSLSAEQMYYWAGGRKIYLSVVPNKYFVVLDESAVHRISKSLPSINSNEKMSRINYKEDDNGECYYTLIDSATMDAYGDAVLYSAPYLLNNQCEVGLTNIFYVALKSESEKDLLYKFAEDNCASIISENIIPLWYKLSCTNDSSGNSLEMANWFVEVGGFVGAGVEMLIGATYD